MNSIITETAIGLFQVLTKESTPLQIISKGVELLNGKPISGSTKKQVLKHILTQIARGSDGIMGTDDDRISPETLQVLLVMVDSQLLDVVIDGVVATLKKVKVPFCFKFWK